MTNEFLVLARTLWSSLNFLRMNLATSLILLLESILYGVLGSLLRWDSPFFLQALFNYRLRHYSYVFPVDFTNSSLCFQEYQLCWYRLSIAWLTLSFTLVLTHLNGSKILLKTRQRYSLKYTVSLGWLHLSSFFQMPENTLCASWFCKIGHSFLVTSQWRAESLNQ